MARVVDETVWIAKRNEILDCAQRRIYTTGYTEMSIQDIITELGISKGAFYHYFTSKSDLLEALLERTSEQGMQVIVPIAYDANLSSLVKLEKLIQVGMQWKSTQKPFMMAILKAWYSDENALVRQKLLSNHKAVFGELLNQVFLQGIREGSFDTKYPDMAGKIVFGLMTQMSDSLGYILLRVNSDPPVDRDSAMEEFRQVICAYTDSIEKIVGAQPGSIHLIDLKDMDEWLPDPMKFKES
jgi:TetR/AcrR family transcriptional repressor of nem operon